jgi:hypothetical protein
VTRRVMQGHREVMKWPTRISNCQVLPQARVRSESSARHGDGKYSKCHRGRCSCGNNDGRYLDYGDSYPPGIASLAKCDLVKLALGQEADRGIERVPNVMAGSPSRE